MIIRQERKNTMNQEIAINTDTGKSCIRQWLFNPFQFIAGGKALILGLVIILITSILGSLSNTHFDGVLDVHTGLVVPTWLFVAEGLINWLSLAFVLAVFGLLFRGLSFRIIDVFGTQALARWPHIITAAVALAPGYQRYTAYIASEIFQTGDNVTVYDTDVFFFGLAVIVLICVTIWMVALMYRAYAVSCNLKGGRAIGSFIAGLIIAEVLSKLGIILLLQNYNLWLDGWFR